MDFKLLRTLILVASAIAASSVQATLVQMADRPMSNSIDPAVKTNVMFILDRSGSMAWSHLPDVPLGPWKTSSGTAAQNQGNGLSRSYGYASVQCNPIYFDPAGSYLVPVHADGTSFPNARFNAAPSDGFDASYAYANPDASGQTCATCTVGVNCPSSCTNLASAFRAFTQATSDDSWDDPAQGAYYYQYSGTVPFDGFLTGRHFDMVVNGGGATGGAYGPDSNTTYYKECASVAPRPASPSGQNGYSTSATGANNYSAVATGAAPGSGVFTRVNVTTADAATQQKFANWYSYYRTRLQMMKSSAGWSFKEINAPQTLRLGLLLHDDATSPSNFLPIRDYSDTTGVTNLEHKSSLLANCTDATTQRAKLYCYLYSTPKSGTTPTRIAMEKVGDMYKGLSPLVNTGNSWNDPVQYSCQRNTAILATDGFWNDDINSPHPASVGNTDATGGTDAGGQPTGKPPYNDTSGASATSMADIAYYYWKTDLRPGTGALATDNVPTTGKDTAKWQHMVTFTLGLGANGLLPYCSGYGTCEDPPAGIQASCHSTCSTFESIRQGTTAWPNPTTSENLTRIDDLWHAAVNGRGSYFSAHDVGTLSTGLKQALAEAAASGAGSAAAVGNLVPSLGDAAYLASYKTFDWTGDLTRNLFTDPNTLAISTSPTWSAQTQLDTMVGLNTDTRAIWMAPTSGTNPVAFSDASLTSQKALNWFVTGPSSPTAGYNPGGSLEQYVFFTAAQKTAATQTSMINYLRGQRGLEDTGNNLLNTDATKLYRGRAHALGDIINGAPVYIKDPAFSFRDAGYDSFKVSASASRSGTVYAGANDGMLHAFDATNGNERWAFIPSAVIPNLYKLADKNYSSKHQYLVDGPLTVSDAKLSGGWRTILIGGLGKGGRAFYALDVTNEGSPKVLWEVASAKTYATDHSYVEQNLGYSAGAAQITKLNGGQWVAVFASGYDNVSPGDGQAHLFVRDLETGAAVADFTTSGGTDPISSGMAWVQGWTTEGMHDNSVRYVYAGDLSGRVWRFDLTNGANTTLLTTLTDGATVGSQPITSRIELGDWKGDINQVSIYVGTGRYLGYCDIDPATPSDTVTYPPTGVCPAIYATIQNAATQSVYAIRDNALAPRAAMGVFRNVSPAPIALATVSGSNLAYHNVLGSGNTTGWYFNFKDVHGQSTERVTMQGRLTGDQNNLVIATNIPANNKCDIGGTGFVYVLNAQSAQSYSVAIADYVYPVAAAMVAGVTGATTQGGGFRVIVTDTAGNVTTYAPKTPTFGNNIRRVSWRELRN